MCQDHRRSSSVCEGKWKNSLRKDTYDRPEKLLPAITNPNARYVYTEALLYLSGRNEKECQLDNESKEAFAKTKETSVNEL